MKLVLPCKFSVTAYSMLITVFPVKVLSIILQVKVFLVKNMTKLLLSLPLLLAISFFSLSVSANSDVKKTPENKKEQPAYFDHLTSERKTAFDPYIITPHKMTYLLPLSYSNNINKEAYKSEGDFADKLNNIEAKFQISLKVPLTRDALFTEGDSLAFGFTLQAWWQLYNHDLSRPFRETNYQPEIFYTMPLNWQPAGGSTNLTLGFEHQSNGRTQIISRSWNRFYATFTFAKDNYALSFRPWWRIPEGDEITTPEESGNDNPDIIDYMGHFELIAAYKWNELEFAFTGRQNFRTHKGGMELGMTFPLSGKLKGYLQYNQGYGESLIDYNHSQQRIGVGIALTEIF